MNPGEHLYIWVSAEVEFKWIVNPDQAAKLKPKDRGRYFASLTRTLEECATRINPQKIRDEFNAFGVQMLDFAYSKIGK